MICYRDTTFCMARCANRDCDTKYTEQVQLDAAQWWGGQNAPVSLADLSVNCDAFQAIDHEGNRA